MFEWIIARNALLVRKKRFSTALIAGISLLIISLVIWLVVVFLSVSRGIEKQWVSRLVAITAPVQLRPTREYYSSYYYLIDTLSEASSYSFKTLGEKAATDEVNPHQPDRDASPPPYWPSADRSGSGQLRDIVQETLDLVQNDNGITPPPSASIRERVWATIHFPSPKIEQNSAQQWIQLLSLPKSNPWLNDTVRPITRKEIDDWITALKKNRASKEDWNAFFSSIKVKAVKVAESGQKVNRTFFPPSSSFEATALFLNSKWIGIRIPTRIKENSTLQEKWKKRGFDVISGKLKTNSSASLQFIPNHSASLPAPFHDAIPLYLEGNATFPAHFVHSSSPLFSIQFTLQRHSFSHLLPLDQWEIDRYALEQNGEVPLWFSPQRTPPLPKNNLLGEPLLLPTFFRDQGRVLGERGEIGYMTNTLSGVQEQRIPIYIAGFYDPGLFPLPTAFVNSSITTTIFHSLMGEGQEGEEEIAIEWGSLDSLHAYRKQLEKQLEKHQLDAYWTIHTYEDWPIAKEILSHIRSEQSLFTLLSFIILLVAATNIISMLILLVSDKKKEIAILRAMGATKRSILFIFLLASLIIGSVSLLIGIGLASITLHYLPTLLDWIQQLQGYPLVSPTLYGEVLPHQLDSGVVWFVVSSALLLFFLAGIFPAMKASIVHPAKVLR